MRCGEIKPWPFISTCFQLTLINPLLSMSDKGSLVKWHPSARICWSGSKAPWAHRRRVPSAQSTICIWIKCLHTLQTNHHRYNITLYWLIKSATFSLWGLSCSPGAATCSMKIYLPPFFNTRKASVMPKSKNKICGVWYWYSPPHAHVPLVRDHCISTRQRICDFYQQTSLSTSRNVTQYHTIHQRKLTPFPEFPTLDFMPIAVLHTSCPD